MKLVRYWLAGSARLACRVGADLLDCNAFKRLTLAESGYGHEAAARLADRALPLDVGDWLAGGAAVREAMSQMVAALAKCDDERKRLLRDSGILLDPARVTHLPPLAANATIYCVGRNYKDHAEEVGLKPGEKPAMFVRSHRSLTGHGQPLLLPRVSRDLDWETELAILIGRPCRAVSVNDALSVIGGYTIFNDGSVRDYQFAAPHPTAGKNFLRSGAMGPSVLTADELADPQAIELRMTLNGETLQHANTRDMLFSVADIIAYISDFTPLFPGDVISTGTPAGVGKGRKPPRYLAPGDRVRMEIGPLDALENGVIEEPAALQALLG